MVNNLWLVVSNMNFVFHNIWDVIFPIDFHIFQDGFLPTNQSSEKGDDTRKKREQPRAKRISTDRDKPRHAAGYINHPHSWPSWLQVVQVFCRIYGGYIYS